MSVRYHIGDVRTVLATMPENSVDLIMTSPPFLALRSYLPGDHPDKALEIGSEATPGEFIDTLLDVVEACERVLAPHGSIVFELGDTYAGSTADGGDNRGNERYPNGRSFIKTTRDRSKGWPLDKSLTLIPELFRIALVYGFNPLTGRTTPRWRARNVVRWCRPNPPVGALGDKFRPATTDLVVACKARDRYFDLDAVRTEHKADPAAYSGNGYTKGSPEGVPGSESMPGNPAGAPPLDHWIIPTAPYKGAHYATYPPDLCVRPIKAMCPERVCTTCGKPSRRITEQTEEYAAYRASKNALAKAEAGSRSNAARGRDGGEVADDTFAGWSNLDDTAARGDKTRTLGWTDCGHDTWRPGHVLDPFAGSATTLAVAHGHGRDATGIDLDPRNAELAYGRLGMFLEVIDQAAAPIVESPHLNNPKYRAGYLVRDGRTTPRKTAYGDGASA